MPGSVSIYLLPGLTAGILARSGGSLSAGKFSTFISTKLTKGQPKFGFAWPLRSTIGSAFKAKLRSYEGSNQSAGSASDIRSLQIYLSTGVAEIDGKGRQRG